MTRARFARYASASVAGLWVCAWLAACSCGEGASSSAADAGAPRSAPLSPATPAPQVAPAVAALAAPARSPAWTYRLSTRDAARTSVLGPELPEIGRRIRNREATPVAIEVDEQLRVELAPRAELWAFEPAHSFVLVAGTLRVQNAPVPPRAGQVPARIALASGAATLAGAAEATFRSEVRTFAADPSAARERTQLLLVRGGLTWTSPARDREFGVSRVLLDMQGPWPEAWSALHMLRHTDARSAPAASERAWRAARRSDSLADADRRLDAELERAAQLRTERAALLARVDPARAAADADAGGLSSVADVRSFERALAQQARRQLASRELLLLAAERSFVTAAAHCSESAEPECAALARWRERFVARLQAAR